MASTEDIFATHALLEAIETLPALSGATITQILARSSGMRTIYQGTFQKEPAVFRHQSGTDAADIIQTELAELNRVEPWMSTGSNRTVKALFCEPSLGLLVLSQAPGQSILRTIRENPEHRPQLVQRSAEWLASYTKPSRKMARFSKKRYLERADKVINKQLTKRHRGIWDTVQAAMNEIVQDTNTRDCTVAQTHGDFHPSNIVMENNVITGFDLGGSHFIPLVKDVARFLVSCHQGLPTPDAPLKYGVLESEFDMFCDILELDQKQRDVYLPFLIGFDILHRGPSRKSTNKDRIRRSKRLANNFLKDVS